MRGISTLVFSNGLIVSSADHHPIQNKLPMVLLGLLALVKFAGLLVYGPLVQPDSGDYLNYAKLIMTSTAWLHDGGMADNSVPQTVFRIFGYPLLIGLSQKIAGDIGGLYIVILIQIIVSLIATVFVYRIGLTFLKNDKLAILTAAGFSFSVTLTYDQHVLTDSLFNSLFVIALTRPITGLLSDEKPTLNLLLGMGIVYGSACLIRGIGAQMTIFIIPAYCLWIFIKASSLKERLFQTIAMALPLIIVIGGVFSWNSYRTGYAFFTTGAQYVMLQGPVIIEGRGTPVFTGDTPVDQLARKHLKTYEYSEVGNITGGLFSDYGMDAYQSAKAHTEKYISAFLNSPGAFLYHGIRSYEETLIFQFFSWPDTIHTYFKFALAKRLWPGSKGLMNDVKENGSILSMTILVVQSIGRVVAWATFLALLIGPPTLFIQTLRGKSPRSIERVALFYSWGVYFAYSYGLCLIHMVDRFLPAVLPLGIIIAFYIFQKIYDAWKEREMRKVLGE